VYEAQPLKNLGRAQQDGYGAAEIARFMEDRADDIANPTGAEWLEITTTFQAIGKAVFVSAIYLTTGEF